MAAGLCPRSVRNSGACPGRTGTHVCDTCREAARCSNAEGLVPAVPGLPTTTYVLWRSRLLLSRVTDCREAPGQTADDAVLTLSILSIRPGAAFNVAAKRSGLAARLVDEAANSHVHHQTNRQENKQCSRAPVAHQRQRDASNRHITDHHGHIHQNMEAKRRGYAHDQKHACAIFRALSILH